MRWSIIIAHRQRTGFPVGRNRVLANPGGNSVSDEISEKVCLRQQCLFAERDCCSLCFLPLVSNAPVDPSRQRRLCPWYPAIGSAVSVVTIGFLVWLNYGWIQWNLPSWKRKAETLALQR